MPTYGDPGVAAPALDRPQQERREIERSRIRPELAYVAANSVIPYSPNESFGTSGLRHAAGFVHEEFLSRLRGQQGVQFWREMWDSSAVVGAIMFIIQSLLRQVPWTLESASDNADAKQWQEFGESCLEDMEHTWSDFISEVMSFLVFGWSWFEIVLKLRKGPDGDDPTTQSEFTDGRWGIRKLEIRSQDTLWQWGFTYDGTLRGLVQLDTWNSLGRGPVFIPLEKSLHFVTRRFKNNPEGYSLLRPVTRAYHYLKRMEELEAIGWQKDLTGMPYMEVPQDMLMDSAPPAYKKLVASLQTMLQQIQVDERYCAMVPSSKKSDGTESGFKLGLLTTGGRRTIDTSSAIQRYNVQVMQAFSADFLQVGQSKVGTQSLFEGKTNLFLLGISYYLDIIQTTINRNLIPKLMKLNGVPRKLWPQFTHGKLDKPDLDSLGKFLVALGQAGILSPNRNLEHKVLELADLPTPEEEDLEVYSDVTRPTPASPEDFATGLMSERQTKLVLDVNEKVASGKMDRKIAAKLLSHGLGMDEKNAMDFVSEEPSNEPPPGGGPTVPIGPRGAAPAPGVGMPASPGKQAQPKQLEQ